MPEVLLLYNDTAATEIYPLSLHDALPILKAYENDVDDMTHLALVMGDPEGKDNVLVRVHSVCLTGDALHSLDRKSTRLNSSHANISHAVVCLKTQHLHPALFCRVRRIRIT